MLAVEVQAIGPNRDVAACARSCGTPNDSPFEFNGLGIQGNCVALALRPSLNHGIQTTLQLVIVAILSEDFNAIGGYDDISPISLAVCGIANGRTIQELESWSLDDDIPVARVLPFLNEMLLAVVPRNDPVISNYEFGPKTIPAGFIKNKLTGFIAFVDRITLSMLDLFPPVTRLEIVVSLGVSTKSKITAPLLVI